MHRPPDWQLPEEAHRIERSFRFRNFREALTFVQEIGTHEHIRDAIAVGALLRLGSKQPTLPPLAAHPRSAALVRERAEVEARVCRLSPRYEQPSYNEVVEFRYVRGRKGSTT